MTSELSDETLLPKEVWITVLDIITGLLYVVTSVVGVFGNSLAWLYFWSKARDLPTLLFLLTSVNDVFLCTLHLASGISLLNQRHGMLFSDRTFCTIWDVSHFTAVKLSVMLVLVLCVSRAYAVYRPLTCKARFNKYKIMIFLAVFGAMVIAIDQSQRFLKWGESTYVAHDVYCWMTAIAPPVSNVTDNSTMEVSNDDNLIYFYVFGGCLLALPIIPVSVASVITVLKMAESAKLIRTNNTGNLIKKHATTTTILFALAYIGFNIPLFINYVAWTFTIIFNLDLFDKIYNQQLFIFMFGWNWTDVLCVSLNCMVNPVIYYWRISGFRRWTNKTLLFWHPDYDRSWMGPGTGSVYALSETRIGSRRMKELSLTSIRKHDTDTATSVLGSPVALPAHTQTVFNNRAASTRNGFGIVWRRTSLPLRTRSCRGEDVSTNDINSCSA